MNRKHLFLDVQGPKEVVAGDITIDADVEILKSGYAYRDFG